MAPTFATAARASTATATWRAMGSQVVVEVGGDGRLVDHARRRLEELEGRWSRFRADSDVSRMNELGGIPVSVHRDTRLLVRHAITAWHLTGGACDATVLDAVVAAGYGRSLETLEPFAAAGGWALPAPGCTGIVVDDDLGSVTLPADVGFDPGAIGKGLAADFLVGDLLDAGARHAFVSIGGDVAMGGRLPHGDGWLVDVVDHGDGAARVAQLAVTGGAVATSSTQRRRWLVDGVAQHHVIDPATGRPAELTARTATVIAGDGWYAEAKATELLLAAPDARAAVVGDGAALVVDGDGTVHRLGSIDRYLR